MKEDKLELVLIDGHLSHANLPINWANNKFKGFVGPSNLSWRKEVNFLEPLEYLSPKRRKRVKNAINYAESELGFTFETTDILTRKDFLEWLEVYKKQIVINKDIEEAKVDLNWFEHNPKVKDYSAIFIRSKGVIIGGVLIKRDEHQISCSFRAHEHLHIKDSSLSAIIEYFIDKFAIEKKVELILRGSDVNLYGVRLSIGLNDFKLEYGFKPFALDYTGNYRSRTLIFFKQYEKILTYVYKDNTKDIVPILIEGAGLEEYLYKPEDLKDIN